MKVNKSIRIDEDLEIKLQEIAEEEKRTFSNLVTKILEEWIEENQSRLT